MLRTAPILILIATVAAPLAAPAECLDYGLVLPVVGEADGVTNLIAVDVAQSWAFAIDMPGFYERQLAVFSIHDPEAPALVATLPLPDKAADIICRNDRAYVRVHSLSESMLVVLDIHDPSQPAEMGRLVVPDYVYDFDVEGDLAVLAANDEGALLVNVALPEYMSVVGSFVPPTWHGDANAVDLRGDRLLLGLDDAYNDGYLYWLDVSDPAAPVEVGSLFVDRAVNRVFLLDDLPTALVTLYNQLCALDLSDPATLQLTGDLWITGQDLTLADGLALNYHTYGDHAMLLDVSAPFAPRWLALLGGYTVDAARKSSYFVLARGSRGLAMVEISDPADTPIVGADYSGHGGDHLLPTGDPDLLLALRRGYDEVRLVDLSDPSQPFPRDGYPCEMPLRGTVYDSLAYVIGNDGCLVLDLSDPDFLVGLGMVDLPGAEQALVRDGDLMYVAGGGDGFFVCDATNPVDPVVLGHLDTVGYVSDVVLYGKYVVVGDNYVGLKVIDVSDPYAPALHGEVSGVMQAQMLALDGNRCFVGGNDLDAVIEVDLSDPASPAITASLPLPTYPRNIMVHDGRLWVSHYYGLWVYELGVPGAPALCLAHSMGGGIWGLAPLDDCVVTVAFYLLVLRPPCPTLAAVGDLPLAGGPRLTAVPSPFNSLTRIDFSLAREADCLLTIQDLAGRRVRVLWRGPLPAGSHHFSWDGRDSAGRMLASGVYLTRLEAGGRVHGGKVVLVK